MEREFSKEELEQAKRLSYENWEKTDTELGFEFCGQWITNPFVEISGRFEFADITAMCEFYGKENVYNFISNILNGNKGEQKDGCALYSRNRRTYQRRSERNLRY